VREAPGKPVEYGDMFPKTDGSVERRRSPRKTLHGVGAFVFTDCVAAAGLAGAGFATCLPSALPVGTEAGGNP
jgi:hypothetical protein